MNGSTGPGGPSPVGPGPGGPNQPVADRDPAPGERDSIPGPRAPGAEPPTDSGPAGSGTTGNGAPGAAEPTASGRRSTARDRDSPLETITAIGSPLAVITALLFYFGWVRTHVQAEAIGFDAALLDYSLQDYMMRSIDVLYIPALAIVLAAAGLQWLHRRFVVPVVTGPDKRIWLGRLIVAATWSVPAWALVFGGLAFAVPPLAGICVAGFLAVAAASAFYAGSLRGRLEPAPSGGRRSRALVLVLLALACFWATEEFARKLGQAYAVQITADRGRLAAVTVYSAKSLELQGSGIVEIPLPDPDAEYRFRYDGLRLVQRSTDRYFLIGVGWTPAERRVILLREADTIRIELSR